MSTKSFIFLVVVVILLVGAYALTKPEPNSMLSEEDAIEAMLDLYPQLAEYQTNTLPPSSIEAKQSPDGWYLGFVRRGSGVPGILDAQCYHITTNKFVTSVGTYQRNDSLPADNIRVENCTPMNNVAEPATTTPITEPVVTPPVVDPIVTAPCYKGGCSGQLCSDRPDVAST